LYLNITIPDPPAPCWLPGLEGPPGALAAPPPPVFANPSTWLVSPLGAVPGLLEPPPAPQVSPPPPPPTVAGPEPPPAPAKNLKGVGC